MSDEQYRTFLTYARIWTAALGFICGTLTAILWRMS